MYKKVLKVFALITLSTTTAVAMNNTLDNTYYLTVSSGPFISTTLKPTINGSQMKNVRDTGGIFFIGVGYNYNKNFRIEIPFVISNPQYQKSAQDRMINGSLLNEVASIKTSFIGAMINGYGVYEINNIVEAFVGAGLGGGYLNHKLRHVIDDREGYSVFTYNKAIKNQPQIAWNLSAGMGFKINDANNIDIKYQYINLGKIKKYKATANSNFMSTGLEKSVTISGHVVTIGFKHYL